MKILGIDYGRKKMGLAISQGSFAEPLRVIKYSDAEILARELKKTIEQEKVDKVIVGISEGAMAKESRKFARQIGAETFDETLTSQDAQRLSREAGIPQNKRREMEDAYAAAIMLQNYLDFMG